MKNLNKLDKIRINFLKEISDYVTITGEHGVWEFMNKSINSFVQLDSNMKFNAESILGIGDHLKDIWSSPPKDPNPQRGKNISGTSWNFVTAWYLNLIFWKTNILITKGSYLPKPLADCLNVTANEENLYGSKDVLMAFSIPNVEGFEKNSFEDPYEGLSNHLFKNLHSIEAVAINTKTNFSDAIKEDMLWSILFELSKKELNDNKSNIKFGSDSANINMLNNFSYSVISAPSGPKNYKENTKEIIRSKQLSGGFFWGMKTKDGVAPSIREFPKNHFFNIFPSEETLGDHIDKIISEDDSYIENFFNLSW